MTSSTLNPETWSCPLPLRDYPNIVMGHGGGGTLSADLTRHLFLPAFRTEEPEESQTLEDLTDAAVLPVEAGRMAVSTDTFVVSPLFFPGGDIGQLAVHGTVNDVAMSGAVPRYLTVGFILEEGLPMETLGRIAQSMGAAAREAGVRLIAGDTKVVESGHGDGVYINTSGIGVVPAGVDVRPERAKPGDAVLVSGTLGDHGMAIMSVREGLQFETDIHSDTAPLHGLVAAVLEACPDVHVLRDPTRGGVASSLNEIARSAGVGVLLEERRLPVKRAVRSACEMLGMDPIYVANEGKLLAIVPGDAAEEVLAALRAHPLGREAALIGEVVADHPGRLMARTGIGGTRVVPMQIGEQLPRIC